MGKKIAGVNSDSLFLKSSSACGLVEAVPHLRVTGPVENRTPHTPESNERVGPSDLLWTIIFTNRLIATRYQDVLLRPGPECLSCGVDLLMPAGPCVSINVIHAAYERRDAGRKWR